ncbi:MULTISPECIES: hypothetical protein [Enterobacter cloacae complex]|uniref:hypothetical protein n=1 Tax=Enterobacter cloacae complex TaxID=354276 RepID=UPI0020764C35|nr:hypothetical protein [Enterobacter asburiae]MCM7695298.1 hypothetical protein [Enterobacter hormaechei]BEK74077.1 hypothetical protein EATA6166_19690 [Enterobacter asburiae]HEB5888579.1 hypothetical protein [Enterobacter asburiae]
MADYLARVELFGANSEHYETLHESMKGLGFDKTIVYSDGTVKNLPTGTYVGTLNNEVGVVRDNIRRVADPLSTKEAAVFVCDFVNWASFLYSNP